MALSKVTYVDGVTIIGAKNLNDIQDELIRQGEQQTADEEATTAALALKADKSTTYTKTEVDSALALKADKSDTYTKAETYTKTEVNTALALKADKSDTYTKAQVDTALGLKSDKADTYTKEQVDAIAEQIIRETEYSNFEMKSVSGDFIHITDGAGLIPVKDLKIGIEAVQDLHGYDAPWVGGAGKNIAVLEQGSVDLYNGADAESTTRVRTNYIPVEVGTYIASSQNNGWAIRNGVAYDENKNYIINGIYPDAVNNRMQISDASIKYVRLIYSHQDASETCTPSDYWYQLEKGSTATDYAPYANICPISGWTGAKVTRLGKNLFDQSQLLTATNWEKNADGYYYGNRSSFNAAFRYGFPKQPKYKDNTQYTLTVTGYNSASTSYTAFRFYYTDNTYDSFDISATSVTTATVTSAIGKTVSYIAGTFGSEGSVIFYVKDIQLEEGSTATTYEPYNEHAYEVTWQTEAGTVYGGTLDVTTGELVVTYGFADLGDLSWSLANNEKFFYANVPNGKLAPSGTIKANIICSQYVTDTGGNVYSGVTNGTIAMSNGSSAIWVCDKAYSDASTFKTAMDGVQLVYELATPQTYQLTPTEVLTLLGENNIFSDTGAVEELIYRISRQ